MNIPLDTILSVASAYTRPGWVMRAEHIPEFNEVLVEHESPLGVVQQAYFDEDIFQQPRAKWMPLLRRELQEIA